MSVSLGLFGVRTQAAAAAGSAGGFCGDASMHDVSDPKLQPRYHRHLDSFVIVAVPLDEHSLFTFCVFSFSFLNPHQSFHL